LTIAAAVKGHEAIVTFERTMSLLRDVPSAVLAEFRTGTLTCKGLSGAVRPTSWRLNASRFCSHGKQDARTRLQALPPLSPSAGLPTVAMRLACRGLAAPLQLGGAGRGRLGACAYRTAFKVTLTLLAVRVCFLFFSSSERHNAPPQSKNKNPVCQLKRRFPQKEINLFFSHFSFPYFFFLKKKYPQIPFCYS
jgi:hypothetical protein